MDDRFYRAFLPPQTKVCGRRLRRFTLWHHFVLCAIQSPVGLGGETLSVADLLAASKTCTLTFGGDASIRPRFRDIFWRWALTRWKWLFRREAKRLYDWIGLNCSGPIFWREHGRESTAPSGPQVFALVCSLMQRGGMSEAEAWNTSFGSAQWYDPQFAQLEGVPIHFLDEATLTTPFDPFAMTDEEAMATFSRDLPPEMVQPSFDRWKEEKEVRNA
jgi:hypothetical protein